MSDSKVHLFAHIDVPGADPARVLRESVCGRFRARKRDSCIIDGSRYYPIATLARMATVGHWRSLPPQAQCAHCRRTVDRCASPAEILSVSIFCAALSGWLVTDAQRAPLAAAYARGESPGLGWLVDPVLARLIARLVAGDTEMGLIALDRAEELGLHEGLAARVEVEWPEVREHEHTWLPWESGDSHRAVARAGVGVRRCTCGVFEYETSFAVRESRGREVLRFGRTGRSVVANALVAARVETGERVLIARPGGNLMLDLNDPSTAEHTRHWLEEHRLWNSD